MTSTDCLHTMFAELRATMPPLPSLVSDGDRRTQWLASVTQVIQAMPTPTQQWACLTELAALLVTTRYPGLALSQAYAWLAQQCGLEHVLPQVQADQLRQALNEHTPGA